MQRVPGNDLVLGQLAGRNNVLTLSREERAKHLYVCGGTGTGKSKFLENIIRQDIKQWHRSKCGLLLLDPHGSLYDSLIEWLAWNDRILDVPIIPIDLRQDDWIVWYNLLRQRETADPAVLVDNLTDAMAYVWGKARDVEDTSFGFSDLDDMLAEAAKRQGRIVIPNPRPEKGGIYRADNFEFSKAGVPSLCISKNVHLLSRPENAPLRSDQFDSEDYHRPTDEVKPDWDIAGAVQDVDLLFEVGYLAANADKFPDWKPGNEFKPKRDAMMKK